MKIGAICLASLLALTPAALVLTAAEASAQTSQGSMTVRGRVVDNAGNPVVGAAVIQTGTTNGTVTDIDGKYSITVPSTSTLAVSFIGYDSQTQGVDGRSTIDFTLTEEATELGELVVVGYGVQRKADLTGSVAVVDAEDLKKVSNSNISTMLQGKAAGVQITTDGQPGADPSVKIRGLGSFGSTAPLYVIDGVPMGTSIRDFSPNDIETLQVLKDASAAAIYGSRAANGVIIITTKRGSKNQPMRIQYTGYVGMDKIKDDVYEVMNTAQYAEHVTRGYTNSNIIDQLPSGYNPDSENYLVGKVDTDWFDEVFKTGLRMNHSISMSGGGENNTYNVSLDYFKQNGTMEGAGPNYDRFTARVNNNMDVKFIKFQTSVLYSHSAQDNMALSNASEYVQGLYGAQFPVLGSTLLLPPSIKAYDESTWCLDDVYPGAADYNYDNYGYGTYYLDIHGDLSMTNILMTNNLITRNTKVDRFVVTGSADVDLLGMVGQKNDDHKVNYKVNLSYSKTYAKDKTFIAAFYSSNRNYLAKDNEYLQEAYRQYTDGLVENTITYDGIFGSNHVNLVVGQTFERERYHTLNGIGNNLSEPYYLQVSNASSFKASSYESEHVLCSFIGRLNYDFDEKYLLSVTARRDGSSRLSSEDRWETFPSVSAGWRFDREEFFPIDDNIVNLFKVRASYGVLGNENIGEYQYMDVMNRGDYTYSFGGDKVTGSAISNYVNTAIKWEKKKTFDIGLDVNFLSNKIEFNFDYFKSKSEDLLYSVAVPASAGATNESVTMNAATMENTGLEFAVTYRNNDRPVKWEVSANATVNNNEVTSLGVTNEGRTDGYCRTEVGDEVGRFYGLKYGGIIRDQATLDAFNAIQGNTVDNANAGNYAAPKDATLGDCYYVDVNGDGVITDADRDFIGSGMPKVNFGLNARVEWKGLDLSVATYGALGFKAVDYLDVALHGTTGLTNKSVDMLDSWTPENPNASQPRVCYANEKNGYNDYFSDRFIQDANYWKIANIELGYNFNDDWFKGLFSNVRLYVSAQNLHTFTKYEGYNVDFAGGTFTPGYNFCSFPTPRTFMAGLHFTF